MEREQREGHFNGAPGNTDLVSVFTILKRMNLSFTPETYVHMKYVWYAKWVESIMIEDLRRPNNIFAVRQITAT